MLSAKIILFCAVALLVGCGAGPAKRESKITAAGEKALVDHLAYTVIDTQVTPRLGDAESGRVPKNRFFLVQVAVTNNGNSEVSIPGMTLVDDAGNTYPELGDGTAVPQWLGVIRRVSPGQTERGNVAFDAPLGHMKLKLTEDTDASDVYADLPLNLIHEQLNGVAGPPAEMPLPDATRRK